MSEPTVATTASGRASPVALLRPAVIASPPHEHPAPPVAVPLYTRHTRGAIEAERDRRLNSHAGHPLWSVRRTAGSHPRVDTALAARARLATQARADESRWVDDGGSLRPMRPAA